MIELKILKLEKLKFGIALSFFFLILKIGPGKKCSQNEEKEKKLMGTDYSVAIARQGSRGRLGRLWGTDGDGRGLTWGSEHTVLCTGDLYNFVNQCHPNKFNKKEKIKQ